MECRQEENRDACTCTYPGCSRKGLCCECLQYHLSSRQLPGCCFPADVEATYARSFEKFAELVNSGRM